MHLQRECSLAFEIRPRDVNFGSGHYAFIDGALELQVCIRLDASRGSNRGHTSRQIQPRKTRSMLGIKRRWAAGRRGIQWVVHADEPPDDGTSGYIEKLRRFR